MTNQDYPRADDNIDPNEKLLEDRVRRLNLLYPRLDPLMCQVLLKCPDEVLDELRKQPEMWKIECGKSTILSNNIFISDPDPDPNQVPDDEHDEPQTLKKVYTGEINFD